MKMKFMRGAALAALAGAVVLGAAPAAFAASTHAPGDPWEKFNRFAYAVEGALDRVIFQPASLLFRHIAPGEIGHGVHNLIVNLSEPNAFVNDMLQGRFKRAGVPAGRFITNSTIGFLGLFDVASHLGMVHHDNEFGVTLGRYGVGPGPYMFVPLVGPTTVRDIVGAGVDALIDPIHWASYANRPEVSTARALVSGLDERVRTEDQLNTLLSAATDPYATLRSVYLQNKESEIRGDVVPIDGLPTFDDPPAPPPAPPASAGAIPVEEAPPPPAPSDPAPPPSTDAAPSSPPS
jgi:phospholipid-binding lipoprotein MlaA